jgi:hypothetical protein
MRTLDLRDSILEISPSYMERSQIEVTLSHRPDPDWKFVDEIGHEHHWAGSKLPTLVEVIDVEAVMGCDEEGEFEEIPPLTHYECAQCGQCIIPGYKADETDQYISGLQRPGKIEVSVKPEKTQEFLEILRSNERCSILFLDGLDPIIVKIISIVTTIDGCTNATMQRVS